MWTQEHFFAIFKLSLESSQMTYYLVEGKEIKLEAERRIVLQRFLLSFSIKMLQVSDM